MKKSCSNRRFARCRLLSFDYYYQNPPEIFFFCTNEGFCYLNLAGIIKFEKKHEVDSGSSGKITPSHRGLLSFELNFMYMIL